MAQGSPQHDSARRSERDAPRNDQAAHSALKKSAKASSRPHGDCDCVDCYNDSRRGKPGTPPTSSHGTKKRTDANGDSVEEHDGEGTLRLGLHGVPPSPPSEEEHARKGSHSGSSPRKGARGHTSVDREGNHVEEWHGEGTPRLRTHYDEQSLPNVEFPDVPPQYRQQRPEPERRSSGREARH